jgi:hypothetical protein
MTIEELLFFLGLTKLELENLPLTLKTPLVEAAREDDFQKIHNLAYQIKRTPVTA